MARTACSKQAGEGCVTRSRDHRTLGFRGISGDQAGLKQLAADLWMPTIDFIGLSYPDCGS